MTGADYEGDEFNVALTAVVDLNFLALSFVLVPFAPLFLLVLPLMMFIQVKWEKFWLKRVYIKPKKPFQAAETGLVFAIMPWHHRDSHGRWS